MERCPTCGARYREGVVCYRCQTDLRQVLTIEQLARDHAQQARAALRCGRVQEARFRAIEACDLHRTPEAVRILALTALADRDFQTALELWREHRQLRLAIDEP